jgi:murein L,D-transpeptidase YcbB/YkuD
MTLRGILGMGGRGHSAPFDVLRLGVLIALGTTCLAVSAWAESAAEAKPTTQASAEPVGQPSSDSSPALSPDAAKPPADSADSPDAAPAGEEAEPADSAKPDTQRDETPPGAAATPDNGLSDDDAPDDAAATPATETQSAEPGATPSADQQKPAEASSPAPATSAAPSEQAQSSPPDPIVAAVRSKLKDPALRKDAASADIAALEAFYGERSGPPLWITPMGFTAKAQGTITEIQKAGEWGLDPDAFALPSSSVLPPTVEAQADEEIKLALAVLKYARYARGGRVSPSRISPLFDQRSNVKDPKTVLREIEAALSPAAYLVSLQPQQAQFETLRRDYLKLAAHAKAQGRKPFAEPAVQRLIVNMERWRWMPPELGSYYVWDNLPAFTARVMKNGKSIYVEKAIVGQVKYATPIFSAEMRSIVFNPQWVVPETIKLEDLQPRLSQPGPGGLPDVSILRENKLSVSLRGKAIDAAAVDWGKANIRAYTFVQQPGPDNVLGVLKFNFPNKHAIYMHDTVQPELFDETVRTLSHGCIRVHDPARLAALLLAEDKGWSEEQVKSMLAKGNNTGVVLSRPVPVHLTYFTIAADGVGTLRTYPDIYGIDGKMAAALFGKSDSLTQASAAEAKPRRARSAQNGNANGILSGLFGN